MGHKRRHEFSGEVAKWLGNGLQNRYTRVRIPSSPPSSFEGLRAFGRARRRGLKVPWPQDALRRRRTRSQRAASSRSALSEWDVALGGGEVGVLGDAFAGALRCAGADCETNQDGRLTSTFRKTHLEARGRSIRFLRSCSVDDC
jgi:hypothetical protein